MKMQRPIYELLERGIYKANYIPRGRNGPAGVPGAIYNPYGIMPLHSNFFTEANTSIRVLEQDPKRRFLQIQNMSAASDIIFAFGKQASLNDGVTLTPGQVEIFDVAVPTEFMDIFCVADNQRVHLVLGA
jgi:hypothetical protein